MRASDMRNFTEGMRTLRDCYQAYPLGEKEWENTIRAYFGQLQDLEWSDVRGALIRAPNPDCYPDRFPNAGQLKRLALDERRARAESARREEATKVTERDKQQAIEDLKHVPFGDTAQQAYILAASSPFDRLARMWQCETKKLHLDPSKPTPKDIHARRMQDFWKTWDKA